MALRVGVASIIQETNTFAPTRTTISDFEAQRIFLRDDLRQLVGVNTEAGGAIEALERRGATAVPLVKAWAMSGGPITATALGELRQLLQTTIGEAGKLDGLVLSLHGALVGESADSGDLVLLRAARDAAGPAVPIGLCLDLHANVVDALVAESAFVLGYRTYPHVDNAQTGARTAELLLDAIEGRARPVTRLAKRRMLVPPEGQGAEGPLGRLRKQADRLSRRSVLDVSLFPVQPWLDVPGLGFAVTVTTDGMPDEAARIAQSFADAAWGLREEFAVELVAPSIAIERIRAAAQRPVLLSESADSPTAGAAADSPAMVRAFLGLGPDLRAYVTIVDEAAVEAMHAAGEGSRLHAPLGSALDPRFHTAVDVEGRVGAIGDGSYRLTGPVFTGMEVTMGRYARLDAGNLSVLVTERPACTFDPETFRYVGLDVEAADAIVVRSANLFRAGWGSLADGALFLDLPGASTPRFESLDFKRIPRPMYPLDQPDGTFRASDHAFQHTE